VFVNPATDALWEEGDLFTWPTLGDTLERIGQLGADEFYSGVTAANLVADVRAAGGNLSLEDMANYQ
jgi:gamma-glutamyltranspeptidase